MTENETLSTWIKNSTRDMVALETLLTSIPAIAPESGGNGESEKCAALEAWLLQAGFSKSQFVHLDAPDTRVKSGVRPNLLVTIPGKSDDFAIWVMAHMDVVPTGELSLWESDPWTVVEKDGKLFGRGVEDNQQGLVSAAFAGLYSTKMLISICLSTYVIYIVTSLIDTPFVYLARWIFNRFMKNENNHEMC